MARKRGTQPPPLESEPTSPSSAPAAPATVRGGLPVASVVKIFTVASKPNYMLPWQMGRQEAYTGSGFVVKGKRIITNAHVVSHFTTVRVRRHGGEQKWPARVVCINHTCDLAMLQVDDDEFWASLPSLDIVPDVPQLDEKVLVIGYPMGGDTISVTRGVVSRVTTLNYDDIKYQPQHSPQLLAVQIDAAINSGNSGGPVFRENGSVIGVAFSGYAGSADNIGYIIPTPVLNNFISTVDRDGVSKGVSDLGLRYELCENPSMRKRLKMHKHHTGVHVIRVSPLGPCHELLKVGDVVLAINDRSIANDGTISFRQDERVGMQHIISSLPIGQSAKIKILREGQEMTIESIARTSDFLVPPYREPGDMPSYLIVGGVIFTPLTSGLMELCIDDLNDEAWEASRKDKKSPDQQVIVMITILSHPINHGYTISRIPRLAKCNEVEVNSMKDLKALVDKAESFIHFETANGRNIIFDVEECRSVESEILKTHAVPAACSPDLLTSNGHATADLDESTGEPAAKVVKMS